jgi:UDPglucose 6-dehydrogenase
LKLPDFRSCGWQGTIICVAMIGTGYVGLVSGARMADFGHDVICVDKDAAKIAALERGEILMHEPGLPDLVRSNVNAGRLAFGTTLNEPVRAAEAVFVAVGTAFASW